MLIFQMILGKVSQPSGCSVFTLEILKKVDKGPPFVSSSHQPEASIGNFFRDIRAKVNFLDSL